MRFYFLHSYYFECTHTEDVLAVAEYGAEFGCAVQHANIFGVQFHPEKSHRFGTQLLQNFSET
jgi:glutamine amidotransferase